MIFSLVKNNESVLFSMLILDFFCCLHCLPNRCRSRFGFLNFSNFFVSEQNYKVLVCIFLECEEHFGTKIILICRNFLFLSLNRFTCLKALNVDVHVLFDDVFCHQMRFCVLTIK